MKTRTRSRRNNSHKRSKRSKRRRQRSLRKSGGGVLDYLMPEVQTARKETVTNALLFGIYKSLEKENIKDYHQLRKDMEDFIR
jgi:hypothetical protein